jgi:hypothetical protein
MPPSIQVNFLVTERVEDILPMLQQAARGGAAEETMRVPAERL